MIKQVSQIKSATAVVALACALAILAAGCGGSDAETTASAEIKAPTVPSKVRDSPAFKDVSRSAAYFEKVAVFAEGQGWSATTRFEPLTVTPKELAKLSEVGLLRGQDAERALVKLTLAFEEFDTSHTPEELTTLQSEFAQAACFVYAWDVVNDLTGEDAEAGFEEWVEEHVFDSSFPAPVEGGIRELAESVTEAQAAGEAAEDVAIRTICR
jgi:hypothetical protein